MALVYSTNIAIQWLRYIYLLSRNEEKRGEYITKMLILLLKGKYGRGVHKLLIWMTEAPDLAWIADLVDGMTRHLSRRSDRRSWMRTSEEVVGEAARANGEL